MSDPIPNDTELTPALIAEINSTAPTIGNMIYGDDLKWLQKESGLTRQSTLRMFYDRGGRVHNDLVPKSLAGTRLSEVPDNMRVRVLLGLGLTGNIGQTPTKGSEVKTYNDENQPSVRDTVIRTEEFIAGTIDPSFRERWKSFKIKVSPGGYLHIEVEYMYGYAEA
jgi:hypothetical protein